MTTIIVQTLGGLRIERDGEEVRDLPAQPVRCAVFLYLSLERSATRDELAALFWPEVDDQRARHSLSQTLYELRRQLGDDWVRADRDRVEVTEVISVDVLDLKSAVETGDDEEALDLYRGPFLEGFHLGETASFEQWIDRQRFELERLYRDLCRSISSTRVEAGDVEGALAIARRWVKMDPLEDEAQHLLIELLARMGRRSEALQQYEVYEELIDRELDVEPLDETKALVRELREGSAAARKEDLLPTEDPEPIETLSAQGTSVPATMPGRRVVEPQTETLSLPTIAWHRWGGLAAALVLALVAAMIYLRGGASADPDAAHAAAPLDPTGIAVLPFVNMSPDPDQEYFSDGITEDLLTALSRIEGLRVISRTSVMRYKDSDMPIADIARELDVTYVLEGSVRREENNVRITAQLIDAARDDHLWAENYDRALTGIFEVQSEIAQRIAEALEQRFLPADGARIAQGGTGSLTAYDLLLRGRDYLNRPGEADVRNYEVAMDFFRQAMARDPAFARSYAGLSEAFRRHVLLPVTLRRDSMIVYASRAVEMDPELAEAATELGYAHLFAGEYSRAEEQFRHALSLEPNQADAMSGLARLSVLNGRLDQAVLWERQAVAVDPLATERLYKLGRYLFDLGALEDAQSALGQAVALAPDHPEANYLLAQIYLLREEDETAERQMRRLERIAADHPAVHVAIAKYEAQRGRYEAAEYHLAQTPMAEFGAIRVFRAFVVQQLGEQERALELLSEPAEMMAEWEQAGLGVPPRGRLYVQLIRGDRDGALATLEAYWRTGLHWIEDPPDIGIYWIDRQREVESLRGDPRFEALLSEMRAEFDAMRIGLMQETGDERILPVPERLSVSPYHTIR